MPAELEAYVGASERDGDPASRARAELSAYLAEIARDDRTTRSNVTLLSRYLFAKRLQGTAECYAALVTFEGLARELRIDGAGLVDARMINRAKVSDLFLALMAKTQPEIRDAAKRLWESLFQTPLPDLRRR